MIPYNMIRPSHKELYQKILEAKKSVSAGRILIVDPIVVAEDAIDLNYAIENELVDVLKELLDETDPHHYTGTRPPQRSYEKQIQGLELFAFSVESNRFNCKVYYKFAVIEGICWLVSLHQDRLREKRL